MGGTFSRFPFVPNIYSYNIICKDSVNRIKQQIYWGNPLNNQKKGDVCPPILHLYKQKNHSN